jgi:anti-sigma factor RsiW
MNCQTSRELLSGYLDGELDLVNSLEIEAHLRGCQECSSLSREHTALKSALTHESLYHKAPDSLRMNIRRSVRQIEADDEAKPPRRVWPWQWISAAAMTAAGILLIALFFWPRTTSDDLLAKEVVSGHVRSMMVNSHLTDVLSSDQHTVKPWFDGKLDFAPPVVDLASNGFPLVGGRLDYLGDRPVAALVYQRRQHIINLFIFPSGGSSDAADQISGRQGYNIVHWNRSGMSFWAVSDVNLNDLQEFAREIQN